MISKKTHSPNSRNALRLALLASTILAPFSHGLPRGSKKDGTVNSNSFARRTGPSRAHSSLTTLRDSFPCEADAASSGGPFLQNGRVAEGGGRPASGELSRTSEEAGKVCSSASDAVDAPRGGGDVAASSYDDEEIDRMVEDLIAGVEGGFGSGGPQEDSNHADLQGEALLDPSVDEEANNDFESNPPFDERDSQQTSDCVGETIDSSSLSTKRLKHSHKRDVSTTAASATSASSTTNSAATTQIPPTTAAGVIQRTPTAIPDTIPTNAYYRFLVRRGPKGHILASFSLLSVQWIHTYLPPLYRLIASLLLTCRIYDPRLLRIKERQRRLAMQRRRDRTTLAQTLKDKFSSSSRAKKRVQKEADRRAALKLQQLLKTTMATSLDWKEVRYRYLSVGFRKRHELGAEYVREKPVLFMGEQVGGGLEEGDRDGDGDGVVLDLEEEFNTVASEDSVVRNAGGRQKGDDGESKKQQRRKRKITDWVVQAFATRSPSPLSTRQHIDGSSPIPNSALSLWKSVERNAILNAAWESRNAEKAIWVNNQKDPLTRNDAQRPSENDTTSNFGSAGASKMFQSVMTRVGSNGRILGAYPMDAPPIEECANRRGVLDLARRYGYGNWVDDGAEENWEESGGEEDESWGGGDLFFDDDEEKHDRSPKGSHFMGELSKGSDLSRPKKIHTKKHPTYDALHTKPTTSRRKKKRTKASQTKVATMAFAGGGPTNSIPQRKVTFEFGIGAQSSQRKNDSFPSSNKRTKQTPKPTTERNVESIRSQLQERKSSMLFTSDTRVKAPMQLLNKSMKKRCKKDMDEIEQRSGGR